MRAARSRYDAFWPGAARPDRPRRLFVSVNPGPVLIQQLSGLQSDLRRLWGVALGREVPVHWMRAAQFHLTLAFPGPVAEERLPLLSQALERCAALHSPGTIEVGGIGTFPAIRMPRIIWVGVRRGEWLTSLMEEVREACRAVLHNASEEGAFPHITLGRVRAGATLPGTANPLDEVRRNLEAVQMTWHVDMYHLMESLSSNGEGKYLPIRAYRLGGSPTALSMENVTRNG